MTIPLWARALIAGVVIAIFVAIACFHRHAHARGNPVYLVHGRISDEEDGPLGSTSEEDDFPQRVALSPIHHVGKDDT
jgi:hypothetical protein